MLHLYNYFRSSASFRVRIALNLKGLDYHAIPIHLLQNGGEQFSTDYVAVNPQSLVPALQNGNHIITQSLAIIEYLDEIYPAPPLLPNEVYQKALVRSFALAIAADIHPLNNLRILKYLTNELNVSEEQKTKWYQHWVARGFSALEKMLGNHHKTNFCFGNEITLADVCLVPQMYNARRYACDLSEYSTLIKIDENCQRHEAFIKAWPHE